MKTDQEILVKVSQIRVNLLTLLTLLKEVGDFASEEDLNTAFLAVSKIGNNRRSLARKDDAIRKERNET